MKISSVCITVCAALFLAGCQENREDAKAPISQKDFYKTIGEQIPFETGMEWIDNYQTKASASGRTESLSRYHVTASTLQAALASVSNPVGISFHYATDEAGETHILLIPIAESMQLWADAPGRIIVDANTDSEIPPSTAQAWVSAYTDAHPAGIWFHFFGVDIFRDMSALPFFSEVDIQRGINTAELTPELLLIVWNNILSTPLGRTMTDGVVYDASNACPPCAVQ